MVEAISSVICWTSSPVTVKKKSAKEPHPSGQGGFCHVERKTKNHLSSPLAAKISGPSGASKARVPDLTPSTAEYALIAASTLTHFLKHKLTRAKIGLDGLNAIPCNSSLAEFALGLNPKGLPLGYNPALADFY